MKTYSIKGLIFGQALGDALGLAAEFMTREEVTRFYPRGIRRYKDIISDAHRNLWQKGAWTDDTDQMLCIMDSLVSCRSVCLPDIATRFVDWKRLNGIGIGRLTMNLLSMKDYTEHPLDASKLVWEMSGQKAAPNGGIMRTAILGCWEYADGEAVKKNTEDVCRLTHYDPRCVGSCVIITYIVSQFLQGHQVEKQDLLNIASGYDEAIGEYIELAYQDKIENLMLDEPRKIGYTLKTMSAALWAYNFADDFCSGIRAVIEQGGDADTNGAVAGALLGMKFGYKSIPLRLKYRLIGKKILKQKAKQFTSLING